MFSLAWRLALFNISAAISIESIRIRDGAVLRVARHSATSPATSHSEVVMSASPEDSPSETAIESVVVLFFDLPPPPPLLDVLSSGQDRVESAILSHKLTKSFGSRMHRLFR